MSSAPRSDDPSPAAEPGGDHLAALVAARGEPLLEGLELHAPGAREHADAAATYAFTAAVELGFARDRAELVREMTRLHEVGKVYLRADQLLAESAGSASGERADRSHFEAGRELARGAGVPGEVSDWILHTRERFDGDGPGALAGDAIPIESRIARAACACDLALADPSGDATPTERRHRAGEELRSRSGTELDPGVVEALCAVLDRLD